MRVYIKGGAWSNTEDEALKACIQKYGDKDWGKIASVISRKSADQCKARWTEWLHPDIKKDDFTADEDEKLLMLGRVLKGQWRTIATQIKGRTAAMCQDRFAELIEMAENDGKLTEAFLEQQRRDQASRLDSRPAKKDVKDTTGYEAQLQEELTARLANKKGKKGLRKERQQQLEDTQFRVKLQRQRELAEAGAMTISQQKKMKKLTGDAGAEEEDTAESSEFTPVEFDKVWHSGAKRKSLEVVSHLEKKRLKDEAEGTEGLTKGLSMSTANTTLAGKVLPPALRAKLAKQQSCGAAKLDLPAPKKGSTVNLDLPAPKQAVATAPTETKPAASTELKVEVHLTPYTSVAEKLASLSLPVPLTSTVTKQDERTAAFLIACETQKMMRADANETTLDAVQSTLMTAVQDAIRGEMPMSEPLILSTAHREPAAPYAASTSDAASSAFELSQLRRLKEQLSSRREGLRAQLEKSNPSKPTNVSSTQEIQTVVEKLRHSQQAIHENGQKKFFYQAVLTKEKEEMCARREAMDREVLELKATVERLQVS